ncbi:MAG: hypothetical protein ABEI31_02290 [Halodesulfurarchaeum sp.]
MVTRRHALRLGGLLLAGSAGCLGSPQDQGGTPTETRTETPTATPPTDTPTTTASEPPAESVIEYDALTSTQQEAFDRARSEAVRFSTGVPGLDKPIHYGLSAVVPFREHSYVLKDGTYYTIQLERSGFIQGTHVSVEPVNETPEDAISLANRSGEGIDLIKAAIEGDGDAAKIRVEMPESIATDDIVRYQDSYYRVSIHSADYEYFSLTVEKRS